MKTTAVSFTETDLQVLREVIRDLEADSYSAYHLHIINSMKSIEKKIDKSLKTITT